LTLEIETHQKAEILKIKFFNRIENI